MTSKAVWKVQQCSLEKDCIERTADIITNETCGVAFFNAMYFVRTIMSNLQTYTVKISHQTD